MRRLPLLAYASLSLFALPFGAGAPPPASATTTTLVLADLDDGIAVHGASTFTWRSDLRPVTAVPSLLTVPEGSWNYVVFDLSQVSAHAQVTSARFDLFASAVKGGTLPSTSLGASGLLSGTILSASTPPVSGTRSPDFTSHALQSVPIQHAGGSRWFANLVSALNEARAQGDRFFIVTWSVLPTSSALPDAIAWADRESTARSVILAPTLTLEFLRP